MLTTLVFLTYLDVRVRISISDLRLSSDRRTILIGRGPHLAMTSSPGEVPIRMNIIFTPRNQLKQLSQYEWFVSRTETPYRKCRKIVSKLESGWYRFENYEVSSLYHCRKRHKQVLLLKWTLKYPSAVPDEESQDLAFVQTQPRSPHPTVANELLRIQQSF